MAISVSESKHIFDRTLGLFDMMAIMSPIGPSHLPSVTWHDAACTVPDPVRTGSCMTLHCRLGLTTCLK